MIRKGHDDHSKLKWSYCTNGVAATATVHQESDNTPVDDGRVAGQPVAAGRSLLRAVAGAGSAAEAEDILRKTTAPSPSPFLSFKDQRAADLAYKLLRLELEQLDKAELDRVRSRKLFSNRFNLIVFPRLSVSLRLSIARSQITISLLHEATMPFDSKLVLKT